MWEWCIFLFGSGGVAEGKAAFLPCRRLGGWGAEESGARSNVRRFTEKTSKSGIAHWLGEGGSSWTNGAPITEGS